MAFIVDDETGNITLVQGDSGKYPVEQVPNDKHYTAYFGIYNNKRKPVGFEINVDIPAYNAGQIIYDNDLYCWSYQANDLYTLRVSPYVDDPLYDDEGEETEYDVTSINSIATVDNTYTRNSSDDIDIYNTDYYAWEDENNNIYYTKKETPVPGDVLYDENFDESDFVYDTRLLYAFYDNTNYDTYYSWYEHPPIDDRLIDKYEEYMKDGDLWYVVTDVVQDSEGYYIKIQKCNTYCQVDYIIAQKTPERDSLLIDNGIYKCTRKPSADVKTYDHTIYAWTYSSDTIYTLNENPTIGDVTYTSNLVTNKDITSIGSIIINSNEYIRNVLNDIPKTVDPEVIPTTNIEFPIPASLTDFLKVPVNEDTAEYYFGIKLCDDEGGEDTLLLGDSQIGDLNTITVYPKKLEGTISNG